MSAASAHRTASEWDRITPLATRGPTRNRNPIRIGRPEFDRAPSQPGAFRAWPIWFDPLDAEKFGFDDLETSMIGNFCRFVESGTVSLMRLGLSNGISVLATQEEL